jgi:hypothetical protein
MLKLGSWTEIFFMLLSIFNSFHLVVLEIPTRMQKINQSVCVSSITLLILQKVGRNKQIIPFCEMSQSSTT